MLCPAIQGRIGVSTTQVTRRGHPGCQKVHSPVNNVSLNQRTNVSNLVLVKKVVMFLSTSSQKKQHERFEVSGRCRYFTVAEFCFPRGDTRDQSPGYLRLSA